jgi:hypothetical protein
MQLVQPYTLLSGSTADYIAVGAAALFLLLAGAYWGGGHHARYGTTVYRPLLAWQRAGMYFSAGLILSWSLGVLHSLLATPLVTAEELTSMPWLAYTLFYAVVLWVGYMMIWPRGTFSDGRLSHPIVTSLYGICWGLCHGQVFLCIWALAEMTGLNSYWVAAITYLALSAYNFAFHQFFWDVQVSPPHNYAAWNMKKVQFCHVPNLLLGLVWLALWGNFGLWLLFQTFCLLASSHHMRFPAWYDDYQGIAGETR